jgi:hypothetical protein
LLRASGAFGSAVLLSFVTVACSADQPAADTDATNQTEATPRQPAPFRAFTDDSWWNTPLPDDAPEHPNSEDILRYMRTAEESGEGCLRLAGADDSDWGQPVYWAEDGDPEYHVEVAVQDDLPELHALRIPHGAEAADNSDGSMTLFDVERGYVVALTGAEFDDGTWSTRGATVTYLDSNGLHARTGDASDERNLGSHRGNNAAVMMVRYDEVAAGQIEHVLKVASGPAVRDDFVFPMVGSDGDTNARNAPPQGLRFRISPSVDLDELDLDPQTLTIAKALQEYGFYIGDSSGVTALKLEETRAGGGDQLWEMPATALCGLPLTPEFWDVLPEDYRPSPG